MPRFWLSAEGSNPPSSSRESIANLFGRAIAVSASAQVSTLKNELIDYESFAANARGAGTMRPTAPR